MIRRFALVIASLSAAIAMVALPAAAAPTHGPIGHGQHRQHRHCHWVRVKFHRHHHTYHRWVKICRWY